MVIDDAVYDAIASERASSIPKSSQNPVELSGIASKMPPPTKRETAAGIDQTYFAVRFDRHAQSAQRGTSSSIAVVTNRVYACPGVAEFRQSQHTQGNSSRPIWKSYHSLRPRCTASRRLAVFSSPLSSSMTKAGGEPGGNRGARGKSRFGWIRPRSHSRQHNHRHAK